MPRLAERVNSQAKEVLAELETLGSDAAREGLARYGIPTDRAFGIPMSTMQRLARQLGCDHALAAALWATGWYEARTVAALIADPMQVTPEQMDRWQLDFDNWGICDTVCFKLFDRVPHAYGKVEPWAQMAGEFQKRAGYALLACLALHDKQAEDAWFLGQLPLIEQGAVDGRNFVKKGVLWALRGIANRGPECGAPAVELARRLAASATPSAKWVGKTALREMKAGG